MKRPSFAWLAPSITALGNRFGFDAHYFAKNGALVTFSHAISILKGIITGYLVTRLFPPAMYGEYRFVMSVLGFTGFIGLPGLSSAIASAVARKEPVSLARLTAWLTSIVSIGAVAIAFCIALLPHWGRMELWPLFAIAALLFVPNSIATNLYGGIIRGTGAFGSAFKVSLTTNVTVTAAVLLMLVIRPSSLLLFALTTGIPAVIYIANLIPFERLFRTAASQASIKKNALWLSFATIPSTASWYLDGLIISAYFGVSQLALFSVAILIPEQVKVWMKEMFPVIFAKQARGEDTPDRRRKMHKAALAGTAIFAVGIVLYMLITPFIMPVLFPLYPADQLILLTNVSAITLISAPATIYPQFLEARSMVKELQWANWSASAVFLIALVTLIPAFGPLGAVIARGLFRFSFALSSFIIVWRTPYSKALS